MNGVISVRSARGRRGKNCSMDANVTNGSMYAIDSIYAIDIIEEIYAIYEIDSIYAIDVVDVIEYTTDSIEANGMKGSIDAKGTN